MSTNVYCDLCAKEVRSDDSFVVETPDIVQAYHYECGGLIFDAMDRASTRTRRARGLESQSAVASGDLNAGDGSKQLLQPDIWKMREMSDRLDATEDLTKRTAAVWKLWLNDAHRGSINQGTFDAMKNLLGM